MDTLTYDQLLIATALLKQVELIPAIKAYWKYCTQPTSLRKAKAAVESVAAGGYDIVNGQLVQVRGRELWIIRDVPHPEVRVSNELIRTMIPKDQHAFANYMTDHSCLG